GDELRDAVVGDFAGHDADCLALIGHRDALSDDAVQMVVFLVQMDVEMELERRGGAGRLERITGRDGLAQRLEGGIQASVVPLVGLGDQRRDVLQRGEHGQLLSAGVPLEHFVEEPEALDRRLHPGLATSRAEGGGIDVGHVPSEGVVDRYDGIDRTRHDSLLGSLISSYWESSELSRGSSAPSWPARGGVGVSWGGVESRGPPTCVPEEQGMFLRNAETDGRRVRREPALLENGRCSSGTPERDGGERPFDAEGGVVPKESSAEQLTAGDQAGVEAVADGGGQLVGVEMACGDVEECLERRGHPEPLAFGDVARRQDAAMEPNALAHGPARSDRRPGRCIDWQYGGPDGGAPRRSWPAHCTRDLGPELRPNPGPSRNRREGFGPAMNDRARLGHARATSVDVDCPPGAATSTAVTTRASWAIACSAGGQAAQITPASRVLGGDYIHAAAEPPAGVPYIGPDLRQRRSITSTPRHESGVSPASDMGPSTGRFRQQHGTTLPPVMGPGVPSVMGPPVRQ